mgnify:CR=1 FL=1
MDINNIKFEKQDYFKILNKENEYKDKFNKRFNKLRNEKIWKKTIVLNEDNLKGKTIILKDEFGAGYLSIAIDSQKKGELPAADKNIHFVLGVPIGKVCSWKIIPETDTSMPKIYFKQIDHN